MTTDTAPNPADDLDDQVDDDATPYDALSELTIDELSIGSRQLKASLVLAITNQSDQYERALAVVAWLHARREAAGVGLGPFLALTFVELTERLAALGPAADDADPTAPAPG